MSGRLDGVHIVVPFVRGSISWFTGSSAPEKMPHEWTTYIRGVNGEDLSYIIRRVTFTLHPSFRQNVRSLENFPFEVKEQGYGEFDIEIRIEFHDPAEGSVTLNHFLKLHPPSGVDIESEPVVNEYYDEFVFNCPTERMFLLLQLKPRIPPLPPSSAYWTAFSEADSLAVIMRAQNYITEELLKVREQLFEYELRNKPGPRP